MSSCYRSNEFKFTKNYFTVCNSLDDVCWNNICTSDVIHFRQWSQFGGKQRSSMPDRDAGRHLASDVDFVCCKCRLQVTYDVC